MPPTRLGYSIGVNDAHCRVLICLVTVVNTDTDNFCINYCICRIHENPLGDEGVKKLVSELLALHEGYTPDKPEIASKSEPKEELDDKMEDRVSTAVNCNGTSQTSGKEDQFGLVLKSLEVGACGITTDGACAVARLIRANIGITTLSLTGNKEVDVDGWSEIAGALEHNTEITTLELHHNALDSVSVSAIVRGLARNTSVHTVDLEGNHIEDSAADSIRRLLDVNGTLQVIHLQKGNQISESVLADIEHLTAERRQHSSNELTESFLQ